MEFAFSDEQEMIRASAESFLADVSDSAAVRAAMASERGYDPALWQRLCTEMVWPAIHIPEQYGGLGLGFVELAILLEQKDCLPIDKHLLSMPGRHLAY